MSFDPAAHEPELVAILHAIARAPDLSRADLDRILKRHPRRGTGLFARSELIAGYRRFAEERSIGLPEAEFLRRVRRRPVRSQSGVTPVTVLTKPFPCPGRCIFCPSDVRMPKSYLADEPGAQRAADNGFDPYLQTWNRLSALRAIGHPVDKIELIVLGGTFTFHPESYQVWFAARCFEALNDFGSGIDRRDQAGVAPAFRAPSARAIGGAHYNRVVGNALRAVREGKLLHASEAASWSTLERAQRANESAACRSVGLSIETRPDHLDEATVAHIRRLGATKVQVGIQSLSDRILAANRRGHDVDATRRALHLLRGAGFKIQGHWMANLKGATVESDIRDYARLFADPDFRPDELKLYPCSLVPSAELGRDFESGAWRPYDGAELLRVVTACMRGTPRWCRLSRVIRDFSSDDIVAGNRTANLREVAERALRVAGTPCGDIRSREIRGEPVDEASIVWRETAYESSVGGEVFLEVATRDDRLVAFARLTLPRDSVAIPEIAASALLREVHVYGASLPLRRRSAGDAQHRGLGRALVERAAARAVSAGFADLAVISAIGTRAYYRKLGFRDAPLYQHRALAR